MVESRRRAFYVSRMMIDRLQPIFASASIFLVTSALTTFQLYSEMLRDGMITDDDRKAECLETLCRESHRLGHLVENVLSLARLERGASIASASHDTAAFESASLEAHINRIAHERAPDVTLRTHCGLGDRTIRLNGDALSQILGNLLENAAKYGANESGTIAVDLSVAIEAGSLVIVVRDHGRGVSTSAAAAIWRPFNRADAALGSQPGLGIGLTVSRALAQRLGGSLRLLPTDAKINVHASGDSVSHTTGASFELRVPIVVAE